MQQLIAVYEKFPLMQLHQMQLEKMLHALEVEPGANGSPSRANGARTRKQLKDGEDGDETHVRTFRDKMRRHITRRVRTFQKAANRARRSS